LPRGDFAPFSLLVRRVVRQMIPQFTLELNSRAIAVEIVKITYIFQKLWLNKHYRCL